MQLSDIKMPYLSLTLHNCREKSFKRRKRSYLMLKYEQFKKIVIHTSLHYRADIYKIVKFVMTYIIYRLQVIREE
jgi:hypothetical protein